MLEAAAEPLDDVGCVHQQSSGGARLHRAASGGFNRFGHNRNGHYENATLVISSTSLSEKKTEKLDKSFVVSF